MKMNDTPDLPIDPEFNLSPFIKEVNYPFTIENDISALFCSINDTPYIARTYSQCNDHEVLNWIIELKVPRRNIFIRSYILPHNNNKKIFSWYAWLQKDLLFYVTGDNLSVYYSGYIPENKMRDLFNIIEKHFQKEEFHNCIYYIDNFLNAAQKILRLSDKFIDPGIHFNDDIKKFEEKITVHLEPDNAIGLIILAGEPGNGQSTYLHYLTRVLRRRFLYLSKWDAPTFDLEMMEYMEYKRPLLVLEDADEYVNIPYIYENSLGQFVKDLLHGKITKKIKKMPVIITLSRPLSYYPKLNQIDSNYIVAKYEFTPLEMGKALFLRDSLGKSLEIDGPTSLNNIFHG